LLLNTAGFYNSCFLLIFFIMSIRITPTAKSRLSEVDFDHLVFGKVFSDHMFMADVDNGQWNEGSILPYGRFEVAPSMSALHHAQAIFEGMKVYRSVDGNPMLFRWHDNYERLNVSAARMCMPSVPEHLFWEGFSKLVLLDKAFIPSMPDTALYVRPVYFATEEAIGVKASRSYRFIIFTTPTGPFYSEPLHVFIEQHFSRSAEGGTGYAKAAGNYGGSFLPTRKALDRGYHQLIWTDARENRFVEESGSMNLMFVFGKRLVTPALSPSKLAGITRDSILKLAVHHGIEVEERDISIDEIIEQYESGQLKEAFGVGTAANVAHIAQIGYEKNGKEERMILPRAEDRPVATFLGNTLTSIKLGLSEDPFGWVTRL
jgi:branched-chain amino acid aminotransferase